MYRKNSNSWLKHWDFIILDLVALQLAYVSSFVLRMGMDNLYHNGLYLNIGIFIALVDICTAFFTEPYHGIMRRGYFVEFKNVLKHVFIVSALVIVYLFMSKQGSMTSRLVITSFIPMSVILVYVVRIIWKKYLLKHGNMLYSKINMLLVSTSDEIDSMLRQVEQNVFNEFDIVGIVLADREPEENELIEGIPVVSKIDTVTEYIQTRWVDALLVGIKKKTLIPEDLFETCVNMGITVHECLDDRTGWTGNQFINRMGGYTVLTSSVRVISSRQAMMKRTMDICGGIVGMILTGIITIFLAPAIYIASPGPIFFSQMRVGKNGKLFKIYKFRSMYMDAEERKKELMKQNEMKGLMFKMENDPRIIGSGADGSKHGLGWFIRKTSLDEFPQFWNVLKGDMSLVGTRPPTVDEWKQYEPYHRGRLAVKPGLTGMWQVSGRSDITDFEEVVKLDMEYVKKEYAKQLISIGSELDIVFKALCNEVDPTKARSCITDYANILCGYDNLTDATVQFSYNKESYKPFDGWTPNSKPSWWGDYNKVKHNRAENDNIKLANLKNVFNALAALFILNRYLCKIVCSNKIMKEPEIKSNLFTMVGWDICILEGNGFVRRLSTNGNMSVLVES